MSDYNKLPDHGLLTESDRAFVFVDNIKCGGCAKTITNSLEELGLKDVQVDHEKSQVDFIDPKNNELLLTSLNKLRGLGYPVVDTEEGMTKLALICICK